LSGAGAERGLRLRLPATSANLGPGFDTLALALDVYLDIEAHAIEDGGKGKSDGDKSGGGNSGDGARGDFTIGASGRSPEICGALERNLLLDVYKRTLAAEGREAKPLALTVKNGIPLGMGCGSSAAVRLAGVALAAHFGRLGWARERILVEAVRLEEHPDNAAACWMGGFVAACWDGSEVRAESLTPPAGWRALVVLPEKPLATAASRAVLPASYARADVVANLQRTAVLTAAFASGRADLIAEGMRDRMHQPYRSKVCPLLPRLLPLAARGNEGILGVALSGAGPAVLVLVESEAAVAGAEKRIRRAIEEEEPVEILCCALESESALMVNC
jgi:homoserine kinase